VSIQGEGLFRGVTLGVSPEHGVIVKHIWVWDLFEHKTGVGQVMKRGEGGARQEGVGD